MATSEQQIQAGQTPPGLWWSLAAGFAAWGLDLGFSYLLERHSCATGDRFVLHLISIACFAIALSGFRTGLAEFRGFPGTTSEEGGSHFDRAHFQALLGMAFSLSFALVVIAGSVPRWILGSCE
jgi:hypothetical protein